jgi:hypothetical protein
LSFEHPHRPHFRFSNLTVAKVAPLVKAYFATNLFAILVADYATLAMTGDTQMSAKKPAMSIDLITGLSHLSVN